MITRLRFPLANQRGQALVEIGISVSFFLLLTIAILEVGRAFMVANMITHAARDAGRAAAVIANTSTVTNRDTAGFLTDTAKNAIHDQVVTRVGEIDTQTTIAALDGDWFSQVTSANGVPTVTVKVKGTFPLMFNLLPNITSPLTIERTVTFRDEGR
jgi:Flp pilus assembly protein TadG